MSTQSKTDSTDDFASDSEDELDWEEVAVPPAQHLELEDDEAAQGPSTRPNIEVTLDVRPTRGKDGTQTKVPGGISHIERLLRIDCHKVHTLALMANASVRNRWINDELLQARLLSLTPLPIQNSFAMIHKSRIPDDVKRGYLFEQAVSRLASWWAGTFTVKPAGHLRSRTFEEVQRVLLSEGLLDVTGKGKGKAPPEDVDPLQDLFEDDEIEIVRSAKSLMKHALMRSGSRDVSSQLFTALCRALGIPTRLVVSLQSVPWQTNVGRSKTPAKHKRKAVEVHDAEDNSEDSDMERVSVSRPDGYSSEDDMQVDEDAGGKISSLKPNGKGKMSYTMKLRKNKSLGQRLGPDPLTTPPVFWTEVFSRPDCRWIPVDPMRAIVNKRKIFDPTPVGSSSRPAVVDNRMMYVLAVEEDGYMRDVTPRYAKQYSAKVAKVQSGGRGRREWWAQVIQAVTRPYRLHRDDVEDDELVVNQFTEGMPTTIGGFKDHPFYVLERHLLRDQVISQGAHELGKFRGEPVYSRSQVLQLKAAENWMRHGRVVRAGEQPLKYVKQRAATLNRRRELEIRADAEGADGGKGVMQGLYAERQTERYVPPPVVDGKIPKNNFGNIDLYTPSMLPSGAAHIPHKGVAKIARQLGFDYAEAVTSFEFRKGKAFPVISGIVVAAENEDTILEAYWEAEHVAAQKEQEKRQQAVLKRWTKLVQGLRIRQRMREQYGAQGSRNVESSSSGAHDNDEQGQEDDEGGAQPALGGGFLTGVEDVVQPYSLPRATHVVFSSPPPSPDPNSRSSPAPSDPASRTLAEVVGNDGSDNEDEELLLSTKDLEVDASAAGTSHRQHPRRIPKSMAALAAEVAQAEAAAAPRQSEEDAASASASASASARDTPARRARSELKSKANPRARATKTGARTPKAKAKAQSQSRRKRRRDDDEADTSGSVSDSEGTGSDGERRDHDVDVDGPRLRAAKRARKQTQSRSSVLRADADADTAVDAVGQVPRSDRVLRTRKGKSEEQLAREREQELAVKRALVG